MKMIAEDFDRLREITSPFMTPESYAQYKELGRSDMRFRWDALYQAQEAFFVIDVLYRYLNDRHIDTALRRIMKECIGSSAKVA
jgi:hypothetical protein